ncbi:hypothetical protein [Amycolatopsis sp. NPDC051071]|uniref:hypothetical protein n=1 Tax=Amycolatopsis sp. NPDC051071 TaxID=3154637 RepID=UPI00341A9A82
MTSSPHQDDSSPVPADKPGNPVSPQDKALPEQVTATAEVPADAPPERKREDSIEIRLTRRNVLIAGATLAVGVGGLYWAMRSTDIADRVDQREQEQHDWQLPPMSGPPLQYKLFGTKARSGDRMALPQGNRPPDWFGAVHSAADRQRWILANGGAWVGGIQFRLMVESLRRSVVIQAASVRFVSRGPVLDGTLVGTVPQGGSDGTVSEIPLAGANLDNDRPVLRALSGNSDKGPLALGSPFPTAQITLDSHAVKAVDIIAEVQRFHTEWEIVLEVLADGAAMKVPIRPDGAPFRTTGIAAAYQAGLGETGSSEDLSANRGRLEPRDPAKLLGGANG